MKALQEARSEKAKNFLDEYQALVRKYGVTLAYQETRLAGQVVSAGLVPVPVSQ